MLLFVPTISVLSSFQITNKDFVYHEQSTPKYSEKMWESNRSVSNDWSWQNSRNARITRPHCWRQWRLHTKAKTRVLLKPTFHKFVASETKNLSTCWERPMWAIHFRMLAGKKQEYQAVSVGRTWPVCGSPLSTRKKILIVLGLCSNSWYHSFGIISNGSNEHASLTE